MQKKKKRKRNLDFSSALYLGNWQLDDQSFGVKGLSTGKPLIMAEPLASQMMAERLAGMQGLGSGLLYPSTLHLFWDLFNFFSLYPIAVFVDENAYPIARWGMERGKLKGKIIQPFAHRDVNSLKKIIGKFYSSGIKPIVVADGFCPQCGKASPLHSYLEIIQPLNGLLIIDDTQGIGILGRRPTSGNPYGYGGGGTLPWLGIQNENVLAGSSLAKAFGIPMAILGGSLKLISHIKRQSLMRVHCSPPSLLTVEGARQIFSLNKKEGDRRRSQLLKRVYLFQSGLKKHGIRTTRSFFPVQSLKGMNGSLIQAIFEKLKQEGIQCFLTRNHVFHPEITFIIRSDHSLEEVEELANLIVKIINKIDSSGIFSYKWVKNTGYEYFQ
ncbi:MAG: aminotransferase class I/II-fold pyridoxal phosphate-dependent enzyme [Bacteroidetes bacterium]|nr:aminotransferase class I/II-fold pyridoxal phosphate-dependent enzyme [Bacteroidota bacterium]